MYIKYFWVKRSYFAQFNANYYIVYFGGYIVIVLGAINDFLTIVVFCFSPSLYFLQLKKNIRETNK